MVAPAGGNSQTFEVLLEFATNQETFERIEKETEGITNKIARAKEMTRLYGEELKKQYPELHKQIEAEKQAAEATEKHREAIKKQNAEIGIQIRNLRAQAREITTTVRLMRDSADDWDRLFNPLAAGGALLTGGIFAAVTKYVSDAENATQATREWRAAQADLARSGDRIGEVLARETLPLIQEAAKVTRQIASFLEAHPEVARFAISAGLVSLVAGTLGKAVTSGIRLVADLKLDAALTLQNRAAQLQLLASENQLRAAGLQAKSSSVSGAGSGGEALSEGGTLGGFLRLAGAFFIGAVGTFKLFQEGIALGVKSGERFQQALVNMGLISEETANKLDDARDSAYGFAKSIPIIGGLFAKVGTDMEKTIKDVQSAAAATPSFLGGSRETQDKIVQAFSDWKQADAQIVQDAMDARKQIVADGEKAIVDITRAYTDQRASIAAQFSAEAAQITQSYQSDLQKMEQDYQNDRAQIVQDGNERIREIQEEEQEKREEIERDFAKAAVRAGADRDALALVQAQEARDEALAEAERGTQEAIARERQETQQRLQELAVRYAQERQQRQQQYEQDLKENALRRAQALKEAQERYQQELKQAREATAQKLREAAEAAQRERVERRQQFIAQLGDLGVTLNSERQLRVNAYNAMLQDVTAWLNQMNAAFASAAGAASSLGSASGGTSTTLNSNPNFSGSGQYGTHDYSGYAYRGIYRMAANGQPEWVMSGNDTKAAERAIGGQLTQANVAQMISLMGALRGAMTYNDQRSFNSGISARQRRDIQSDTRDVLDKMLGGY